MSEPSRVPQPGSAPDPATKPEWSRRGFLQGAAAGLAGLAGAATVAPVAAESLEYVTGGPLQDPPELDFIHDRREHAHRLRTDAAERHYAQPFPQQIDNVGLTELVVVVVVVVSLHLG